MESVPTVPSTRNIRIYVIVASSYARGYDFHGQLVLIQSTLLFYLSAFRVSRFAFPVSRFPFRVSRFPFPVSPASANPPFRFYFLPRTGL
jgi:hypothetical protein